MSKGDKLTCKVHDYFEGTDEIPCMREGRAVLTLKKGKDRLVLISIIFF
jgi:hypothetical protein